MDRNSDDPDFLLYPIYGHACCVCIVLRSSAHFSIFSSLILPALSTRIIKYALMFTLLLEAKCFGNALYL